MPMGIRAATQLELEVTHPRVPFKVPAGTSRHRDCKRNLNKQLTYIVVQPVMSFSRAHPTAHAGWHPSRSQKSPASQCQAQREEEVYHTAAAQ
jgi:hypothetical protein